MSSANRHRKWAIAIATAAIAATLLGFRIMTPARADQAKLGQPIADALAQSLNQVSHNRLSYTGKPDHYALQAISNGTGKSSDKPLVLYMGADFCPYCAALRWPLVITLMRFGQLDGLRYMRSSATDVYANTVTFDLHDIHYQSPYIRLQAVELETRDQQLLQRPTKQQRKLFEKYDKAPYTQYPGAIPFLYLDGRFLTVGTPVSPGLFKGLSWQQVADALRSGDGKLTHAIVGTANQYTAAICQLTQDQPTQVCQAAGVTAATKHLPPAQG